jgi:hypothetical protein
MRRAWIWSVALTVPLALLLVAAGGWVYASVQAGGFVCPITGQLLPSQNCCPLNQAEQTEGYVCPVTGETLPCQDCCPLKTGE